MCAATPRFTVLAGSSWGPLVGARQSGFEQRYPALAATILFVSALKSSRTTHHGYRESLPPGAADYPAILLASLIAALIPFSARIILTCARCRGLSPRIVPMYCPWRTRARRWAGSDVALIVGLRGW